MIKYEGWKYSEIPDMSNRESEKKGGYSVRIRSQGTLTIELREKRLKKEKKKFPMAQCLLSSREEFFVDTSEAGIYSVVVGEQVVCQE